MTSGGPEEGLAPLPVSLPAPDRSPILTLVLRLAAGVAVLLTAAGLAYLTRGGWVDTVDGEVDFLDCLYYATVSLSTTGYGDVLPVSDLARLVAAVLITPLRVLFVVILVGSTLEVLVGRFRQASELTRWRTGLRDHTLVIGYGTKGRSAVETLLQQGVPAARIVVVDPVPEAVAEANRHGIAGIVGDATRTEVLEWVQVERAVRVVVATGRDDTSVLVTLTARSMNPDAVIVAAVREASKAGLFEHSGATAVITSSDAAGRLLAISTTTPAVGDVIADLIVQGSGLDLVEREATPDEVDRWLTEIDDKVVAVVRNGQLRLHTDPGVRQVRARDRLICVRAVPPAARRPA